MTSAVAGQAAAVSALVAATSAAPHVGGGIDDTAWVGGSNVTAS
jgi:hypothetical protein